MPDINQIGLPKPLKARKRKAENKLSEIFTFNYKSCKEYAVIREQYMSSKKKNQNNYFKM